jgi:predicted HD superfamily hydrolase involved in NAD metabolism
MADTYDIEKYSRKLKKYMDESRYFHTQGVRFLSAALAMAHGVDFQKAELAGLLHDSAKCIPDAKKIRLCEKNGIAMTEIERENPFLLHAKLGAFIAEEKYDVHDPEILDAIRSHTTGRPAMSPLEQIVFIADYIEPRRNKSPNLASIRRMAFRDLDETCYLVLKDMLLYLQSKSSKIDTSTSDAFAFYEEVHEDRRD